VVHISASVTHVTEEHFVFFEGALVYWALGLLGGARGSYQVFQLLAIGWSSRRWCLYTPPQLALVTHCQHFIMHSIHRIYWETSLIELQAKLLNYFLGSNKSNINQSRRMRESTPRVILNQAPRAFYVSLRYQVRESADGFHTSAHALVLYKTGCELLPSLPDFGFWFLVCYTATLLATQLRHRCIQVDFGLFG